MTYRNFPTYRDWMHWNCEQGAGPQSGVAPKPTPQENFERVCQRLQKLTTPKKGLFHAGKRH